MSNILIVDDSLSTCILLKSFLEKTNYNVFISNKENDALEKIIEV
jgi:DNA-binding response OmpR family regulator